MEDLVAASVGAASEAAVDSVVDSVVAVDLEVASDEEALAASVVRARCDVEN